VVEIWYLCVVSSFLPRDRDDIGSKQMLMDAIDHFVTLQVQHEPKYDDAIQNSTILRDVLDDPNAQQAAIDKTFADLCKKFVGSVLNSVRELFEALPVQDLDLQTVGRPLLKRLLDTLHAHLCQENRIQHLVHFLYIIRAHIGNDWQPRKASTISTW